MAVGLSDGTAYNDSTEWLATVDSRSDKQRSDQFEINQNSMAGDFQSRFGASDASTMPRQASTELAGALKRVGSTQVPGNSEKVDLEGQYLSKLREGDSKVADFIFGKGENDIRPALVKGIGHLVNAIPDFMTSEPGSIDQIEKSTNLAAMLIGGPGIVPAKVAEKMADGTLGSFMGVKSKTINKPDLYGAQNLEMNGGTKDEIWENHGTFRGADGRWRQEMDDSKATLKDSAFTKNEIPNDPRTGGETNNTVTLKGSAAPELPKDSATYRQLADWFIARREHDAETRLYLPDVLDHPELYWAYPDLKTVRVEPLPKAIQEDTKVMGHMSGDGPSGTLRLRDNLNPEYAKSVILHEVQHQIQKIEGFAQGGGKERFLPPKLPEAEALLDSAKKEVLPQIKEKGFSDHEIARIKWLSTLDNTGQDIVIKNHPELTGLLDKAKEAGVFKQLQNIARSEKLVKDVNDEAFEKYQKIMGEVEARNVEARMNYDKFQRAFIPPVRTEEVPRFQQIELKNR